MKHLADSVLDYLLYLNFSDEDAYDREHTLKLLEELTAQIENNYTENEKFALSDAATRRLELHAREADSTEELGILLTEEQQQFWNRSPLDASVDSKEIHNIKLKQM